MATVRECKAGQWRGMFVVTYANGVRCAYTTKIEATLEALRDEYPVNENELEAQHRWMQTNS